MMKGLLVGASVLALSTLPVHAQTVATTDARTALADTTAPAADQVPDDNPGIVVTASKRAQTLQDTPIAVSVTTAATIEQAQIRDLVDLQSVVPSLRVAQAQTTGQTVFLIRGFGTSSQNPGLEPSVGVFVDGVYRSRSAAQITDLPNIERIEVLRGPQSTLFGKNASAGVISVVTQKPQFKFGGSASATYGNFDTVVVKADVTGPLIADVLAFSLAGNFNRRDGYVRVLNTGDRINDRDRYDVRGQLLFSPGADLEVRLIGDYGKIDEQCCQAPLVQAGPTVPALSAVIGGQPAVITPPDYFSDTVRLSQIPRSRIESYGGSAQIDYAAGSFALTSITAYRELRSDVNDDADFSAADIIENVIDTRVNTFTQEVRITSDLQGPLNFLLGGFYFNEDIDYTNSLDYGANTRLYLDLLAGRNNLPGQGGTNPGGLRTVETILGLPAGTFAPNARIFTDRFTQDNEAYSIFGTIDFKPTDKLTLTGGFNYTKDRKQVRSDVQSFDAFSALDLVALGVQLGVPASVANTAANPLLGLRALQFLPPFLNIPNAVEDGRSSDGDWSYTARAAYKFDRHWNAYATYSTGFKATSWNLSRDSRPFAGDFVPGSPAQSPAPAASAIRTAGLALPNLTTGTRFAGPEQSRVYEAGLKASFPQVQFNVAVFDQRIEGFQNNAFTGTGFALTNAGSQTTRGFEFEGSAQPVDPVNIFVNVTYLDAKYDSFVGSPLGDLSGRTIETISPITMSIGGSYTAEFGEHARLILRGDFNYASQAQVVEGLPGFVVRNASGQITDNTAALAVGRAFMRETDEVNLSATLQLSNGLEVSGYMRNALDDRYLVTIFDGVAQSGSVYGYPNQPRTYGGSVRFKF